MTDRPTLPRFTAAEADQSHDDWGCNCGPGALAAIAGLTLDEVRPVIPGFEAKHYTSPGMMLAALRTLPLRWRRIGPAWPAYGLVRVQWDGPWTKPSVPVRARYRYTHWIGTALDPDDGERGVFDINCMANGSGWVRLADWETHVVPALTGLYRRANGDWHITHGIEVDRP